MRLGQLRRQRQRLSGLITTAAAMTGHRALVLTSVSRHIARLLELTGWDEAPGLRIQAGGEL